MGNETRTLMDGDMEGEAAEIEKIEEIKTCCAAAYQSEWARLLLGESFHPGGVALTERLGDLLGLDASTRVLDVASGRGTSALALARRFRCAVVGIEYSAAAVQAATEAAERAGLGHLVRFEQGDAERLGGIASDSFDAVICECAFCTFPDKRAAAGEFLRVLRPGGQVGLSDLTCAGAVPDDLRGLLAWIACIADAQPLDEYAGYLAEAGLTVTLREPHDEALRAMVEEIRTRLLGVELLTKLRKSAPPQWDFAQAKALARAAAEAVRARRFGYAIITARKDIPPPPTPPPCAGEGGHEVLLLLRADRPSPVRGRGGKSAARATPAQARNRRS